MPATLDFDLEGRETVSEVKGGLDKGPTGMRHLTVNPLPAAVAMTRLPRAHQYRQATGFPTRVQYIADGSICPAGRLSRHSEGRHRKVPIDRRVDVASK